MYHPPMLWTLAFACFPYVPPDGVTVGRYAVDGPIDTFPDDRHTIDDAASPTGLDVRIADGARDAMASLIPTGNDLLAQLETLDGFGTTAGIELRFAGPIDPAVFVDHVALWNLGDAPAQEDVEVRWTDDDATAIVVPMRPLAEGTRYGLVVADLLDADGGEVWPSADLWTLTHDQRRHDAPFDRLDPRYADLLDASGVDADAVDAATVFTTQTIRGADDDVIAAIADTPATLGAWSCAPDADLIHCEGVLHASDFLGEDELVDVLPGDHVVAQRVYDVPVTLWLPPTEGPFPLILYGHGLGGDRGEAHGFARDVADLGAAVVAIDAPSHGQHPTGEASNALSVFAFFGIDFANGAQSVGKIRDHFRAAAWDKAQLLAALRAAPDIDGDGTADLDGRIGYSGHSLGGIMGVELLADDAGVEAGELSVPGGRISEIVQSGETFAPLLALMRPDTATDGDVDRFFPWLQMAIERGDAANHAAQAMRADRDVMVQMVIDDDIIPNPCTELLARALSVDLAPPVHLAIPGVDVLPTLPASANKDGRTAIIYEFAEELADDGVSTEPALHTMIHGNPVGVDQFHHFWQTRFDDGRGEVIDPWSDR